MRRCLPLLAALAVLALPASASASPASALRSLVAAAGRGDSPALWRLLSPGTQKRLGPYARFKGHTAVELAEGPGTLAGAAGYRVVVDEVVDGTFGVAAVAGTRRAEGKRGFAAYAVALRRLRSAWRVELAPPIRLAAIGANTKGAVAHAPAQLAVGVRAPDGVRSVGMWLDGRGFPLRIGGTSAANVTAYGAAPKAGRGNHVVVAFASAGGNAVATAWTLTVR